MTSQSPEFSQFRRRSRIRRRSRSAANVDPDRRHAVESDSGAVNDDIDADADWNSRRRSANNVLSSRLATWLQQRLTSFGGAARLAYGYELGTAAKPPTHGTNTAGDERPHSCCTAAATAGSVDVLHLSPSDDCKCVSCPELADTPFSISHSASAPVGKQQRDVGDKPPRHKAVRKTCSDTGFKPEAVTSNSDRAMSVDKPSLLSVPAVFVTSYTRSLADQHHHHKEQQEQQERRQSASIARQRLISMSDSRLGSSDRFAASSAARIWKLAEFLCIGNAAAAADDRLLCRHSVVGLVDLCVGTAVPHDSADRWAPCTCGDQRRHRRSVLRLNVSRTDLTDVRSCFSTTSILHRGRLGSDLCKFSKTNSLLCGSFRVRLRPRRQV